MESEHRNRALKRSRITWKAQGERPGGFCFESTGKLQSRTRTYSIERAFLATIPVPAAEIVSCCVVVALQSNLFGLDHMPLVSIAGKRLLMACVMGGVIGLEREWRHKDSGLRTNMLICMGAALFTLMSAALAGDATPDKSRVASNIVQGVGFLGAGLILHGKDRVLGLTSAATVFVVAAIGMTCGGGLYLQALVATVMVLISLQFVGLFEDKLGWKRLPMLYEVRANVGSALSKEIVGVARAEALADEREAARHRMYTAVLKVLDPAGQRLQVLDHDTIAGMERVTFSVVAIRKEHARILRELRASDATDQVVVFKDREE